MLLQGKKILLGISGSIAAYKTPELVRQLVKKGAQVKVILTAGGEQFVTPLALSTVAKHEVFASFSDAQLWNNHVELGLWADIMLIAPCSANTLAKLANGICDNFLLAVYLSARCPVVVAPAMDLDMWLHPATQKNVATIAQYGHHVIEPEDGELASGLSGKGRMPAPENLVIWLQHHFYQQNNTPRKKALITAGPTYEQIDPVRFIGNNASGKMGIALAEALVERNYEVTLVLGPSHLSSNYPGINTIKVGNAASMYEACMEHFPNMDLAIMSAAVADFTPVTVADQKIKKGDSTSFQIELTKTKDILASLGKIKKDTQKVVGFALETNNEIANAQAKLEKKNADAIILNSLNDAGAGFGHDTNKVYILQKNTSDIKELPLQSKKETAKAILDTILK